MNRTPVFKPRNGTDRVRSRKTGSKLTTGSRKAMQRNSLSSNCGLSKGNSQDSAREERNKNPKMIVDNINLLVRRIRKKNPEISKEEEKEINRKRKSIIKEMNRERREMRVLKKHEMKSKKKTK